LEAIPELPATIDPEDISYVWDFGSGSVPSSETGAGPHTIQYTTSGVKTVTCTATYQGASVEETINITVNSCPGQMVGTVKNLVGVGLAAYNMRLYEDFNDDGIPDGAAIRSVFTTGSGVWAMASVPAGNYILEQANGAVATTLSIIDQGNSDGIVDTLTPVAPIANPANTAVKVIIRPLQTQGNINVIINI
jgi:PKD repeat protein